jgi:hypothetical protein
MTRGGHFLPFTRQGAETERTAIWVKEELGLGPEAGADPYDVLPLIPARLIEADVFASHLQPVQRKAMFQTHREAWSAIGWGRSPVTGEELILVNPTHHPHRQRASLMEEVVHIVLDHPRTLLASSDQGVSLHRTYDQAVEDEAYSVGAACIIPYPALFAAVHRRGEDASTIAERYAVSPEYAQYRINRAGLAKIYAKQQRVRVR